MKLRIVGRNIFAHNADHTAYVSFKHNELYSALYRNPNRLEDIWTKLPTECVVQVEDGE